MRFLIELPHEAEVGACVQAVKIFEELGSHFFTHADFGCADGVHSAWIIAEAENHAEARLIVPPPYRPDASVTQLKRYTMSDLEEMRADHEG